MAPVRSKRSNTRARASKAKTYDPRGKYAPLPNNASSTEELDAEVDSTSGPTTSIKRKREADDDTPWRLNKRDKRAIKHNILLSKVRDSAIQKNPPKTLKRRRPGNKLKADIGSLVDALPDLDEVDREDPGSEDEWEGVSSASDNDQTMQLDGSAAGGARKRRKRPTKSEGKIVMTSLRHRPGAMKRKRKMEDAEMERFRRNLARMASGPGSSGAAAAAATQVNVRSAEGSKASAASATHADRWAALRGFIGSTMEREKGFAAVG